MEEIAGLMMYSPHQMVPAPPWSPFPATYDGQPFAQSGKEDWSMSDQQKSFLLHDHVRHVLAMYLQDASTAAKWNNELQAFCEALPHGIPVNISSDPRHSAGNVTAEYKSDGSDTSKWPEGLAMAATFDPKLCKEYSRIVAEEYRALGIATALSPQIDLGTEPRWMRVEDTFGAHPDLVTDMAKAYCDGLQTDPDTKGWGPKSVSAMAKHWPGGGSCESGRDAHYPFGKYSVYPGDQFKAHLTSFLEGAFKLEDGTQKTASIMPYYTISYGQDPSGKNVGNSYSSYMIGDLLRDKYGYDGVVCTDWGITGKPDDSLDSFGARCYGVEHLDEVVHHLMILEAGVDQFGGNSDIKPILGAYELGCKKHGEAWMRQRFEQSAVRLLRNFFRTGLFENPYLQAEESAQIVGNQAHSEAGFAAQLKSLVMLKNRCLPIASSPSLENESPKKVYIPDRFIKARKNFFRGMSPEEHLPGAPARIIEKYFTLTASPEEADFAICFIESPLSDGYSEEEGYKPIMLQYRPYTAETAREESIAGGDFREKSKNRSYKDKTNYAANEHDLDLVLETRKAMKDKPLIVAVRMHNPCILSELEEAADAILVDFGVQKEAILELIQGKAEPSGLLPVQLPANMETVEAHCEDKPLDMQPYVDSLGHSYDFGYGLNWSGIIDDERVRKYR